MKKYPLSTAAERTAGMIFSVLTIALVSLLLYYLRDNMVLLVVSAIFVSLIVIVLMLYIINVAKAVIVYDSSENVLRVKGFQERLIDMNKVTTLQTITVKSGHVQSRSLAFSDAEGEVVAIVPTYFTSNRGMGAEPMAKKMAVDLNLEFIANVPEWEYDKEARKVHELEVAKQEKEEAKKRRAAKVAYRQAKMRKKIDSVRNEKK